MPSASDGEAVTVAKGRASRTSGLASMTAATCDELTVACACVSPSGSRSIVGAFQITSGALEPGERVRDVARRRRHRGREHDDVRARLAEQRVGALAVGVGRQRPGVDDVEVAREQLGVPARRRLAVLPEAGRHLLLEEREVARDEADRRPEDVSQGASPRRSGRACHSHR